MAEPAIDTSLETPSTSRLTIRVKLVPQEPPPAQPQLSRNARLLIAAVVAAALVWLGIGLFKSDSPTAPVASQQPPPSAVPTPKPVAEAIVTPPVAPIVQQQPDAPPSPVNEVTPDVPRSALDTIRGTIRVGVRVTLDKQGAVVGAKAEDRGPSRYFERLSMDASRKWTFTPATTAEPRTVLIRFHYTRDGATAAAVEP